MTNRPYALLSFALVSSLAGCGSTVTDGGGGGGSSSTGDDNPCYPDSCTAPSGQVTGQGVTSGGGGYGGACDSDSDCQTSSHCTHPKVNCQTSQGKGVCSLVGADCDGALFDQQCGCDGKIYTNTCQARLQGIDLSDDQSCFTAPGTFACGNMVCESDQYCRLRDEGSYISSICVAIPNCGSESSCDCAVQTASCGATCAIDADGHMVVTCAKDI